MTQYSLHQDENQISRIATHQDDDKEPKDNEIIKIIEWVHTLSESEREHKIYTSPYLYED